MQIFILLTTLMMATNLGPSFADKKNSQALIIAALRDQGVVVTGFRFDSESSAHRLTGLMLGPRWKGGNAAVRSLVDYPAVLISLHENPLISNETLAELRGFQSKHVIIRDVPITDEGLLHVAAMKGVESLMLKSVAVTDEGLPALNEMHSLRRLSLFGTDVTRDGVAKVKAALPHCDVRFNPWNRIQP